MIEVNKIKQTNIYKISKDNYEIILIARKNLIHDTYEFEVLTNKGNKNFQFRNIEVTKIIGELLIKASEIMEGK